MVPTPSRWPRNWGDVGIVADDEDVFKGALSRKRRWELREAGGRRKGVRDEDFLLEAGLGGDELGGLLSAFKGARDDEVKAGIERVEDVSELQALGLAVLVERALEVEERVDAANAGAGVAKDE